MCGIAGIYAFDDFGKTFLSAIELAKQAIAHRGPDFQSTYSDSRIALAHARLSIVDLSAASNQPFFSEDRTECLTFNGEIFNYQELRQQGHYRTTGDVEVLLNLFSAQKETCLNLLNGFFAFAYYNKSNEEVYIVRDRLGIKPLYYYLDEHVCIWASEIKAIQAVLKKTEIDNSAMKTYFRLNYGTGKKTMLDQIHRLLPGHFISIQQQKAVITQWYKLEKKDQSQPETISKDTLKDLLNDSVRLRLQADVPVGCFLSGGVDSSIIAALAKQYHPNIHTFSIGFKDEPYFDETAYAELVAQHIGSTHHTFKLSNDDLLEHVFDFLKALDEPFADSSALNVYILSKYTKQHVKVALSGDGADELFLGYNKHRAEWIAQHSLLKHAKPFLYPVTKYLPQSRNSTFGNKARQLNRFFSSVNLSASQRYLNWASISSDKELDQLFLKPMDDLSSMEEVLSAFNDHSSFEATSLTDLSMVLADDMLVKVDRMSMQHGLEIRNPFLDYRVVNYALNLPLHEKINASEQKICLKKSFSDLLPQEIFTRKKKGFEVPLLKWFHRELKSHIEETWLQEAFLKEQGIFNVTYIRLLKQQLYSSNPGDAVAKVWALIVFQQWWMHTYSMSSNPVKP